MPLFNKNIIKKDTQIITYKHWHPQIHRYKLSATHTYITNTHLYTLWHIKCKQKTMFVLCLCVKTVYTCLSKCLSVCVFCVLFCLFVIFNDTVCNNMFVSCVSWTETFKHLNTLNKTKYTPEEMKKESGWRSVW